ncbi:MAG: sigma-70 family RNA polymerase sigma factor [Rhizobiaceae bacterium]|nr:sigma-70 family RNA polymerase sigma factor [Rhizobiaceae bacterium]
MCSDRQDNSLALLAAKGDGDAFRQLLETHYDRMFRIAYRFCGHREAAEDIAQDVCVSLPIRLKSFKGNSAFSTWLYRVVVNRCRDVQRKDLSSARLHSDFAEVDELRRAEDADQKRQIEWLQETLKQLPDDLRETAILIVGEGMSHAQAADILGVKEGTVSWRMSELKKALQEFAKETA